MRSQTDKAGGVPRAARAARRLHHPQPLGCRHGEAARVTRVRGAGHHQPWACQHAGSRRQRRDARRGDRELPCHRRGDRSAGERRSGELLRARAGSGGRDDPARCRGGGGRRLDRGLHRRSREPDLRPRPGGGASARGGRGRPSLPVPFLLTARAENLLHGPHDLAETIRRLQAYEAAGADVLYAPGLRNLDEVRQVVGAVKRPFNVVTGWLDPDITAAQLAEAGAKRISVVARCRGSRWRRSSAPRGRCGRRVRSHGCGT